MSNDPVPSAEQIEPSGDITIQGDVTGIGIAIGHGASVTIINQIVRGPDELPTRYDGLIQNFLEYYLGAKDKLAPFGGRARDLDSLDAWLNDPLSPHYAALIAPAGRGKSALLAHWVTRLMADEAHAPHVVYFPISIRFGTNLETIAFASLAARMAYIHDEKVTQAFDAQQYRGVFADYMRRTPSDDRPMLVVIDGLDEAASWDIGAGLFPITPPTHLRVLIAARPLAGDVDERAWLSRLGWDAAALAKLLSLGGLDHAGVADVLQQMGNPLDQLATKIDVVSKLHELSEGDPLLVGLYVEALLPHGEQASTFAPDDLQTLKPGLGAYFQRWFDEQHKLWGTASPLKEKAVQVFLNLLAVALGPFSKDDVLALASEEISSGLALSEAARGVRRFVIGDGQTNGYVFSHPRLGEFFAAQMSQPEYQAWQARFLKYGRDTLTALRDGALAPHDAPAYVVRHYAAHLMQANAPDDNVYALMCEPWLRAWEWVEGTPAGFLNDIERAWKRADLAGTSNISKQVKAALCFASIVSLSQNVHIDLLLACIDAGVISLPLGLALARRKIDPKDCALCLARIAKQMASQDSYRVLWEAVEVAQKVENEDFRVHILCEVIAHLPGNLLPDVWATASSVKSESSLAQLLISLSEKMPDSFVGELVAAASKIKDAGVSTLVLVVLADRLPENELSSIVTNAIAAVHTMQDKHRAAIALAALSQLVPTDEQTALLVEALGYARQISPEDDPASALHAVAQYLPEPERTNVFREALHCVTTIRFDNDRTDTFTQIVADIPEGLLEAALVVAHTFRNEYSLSHAYALVSIAERLNAQRRRLILDDVLDAARTFQNEHGRADILKKMADCLPQELINKALDVANTIGYKPARADALAALASRLAGNRQNQLLRQAFSYALGVGDESSRSIALGNMACLLPMNEQSGLFDHVVSFAENITDDTQLASTLVDLSKILPLNVLDRLVTLARNIESESERARALAGLAPRLSPENRMPAFSEAAIVAQAIPVPYERAGRLCTLLPQLPEQERVSVYNTILAAADEIRDLYFRALILAKLAKQAPEHEKAQLLREVLRLAGRIGDAREAVLTDVVDVLPDDLLAQAMQLADTITDERERAYAWSTLARRLPVVHMEQILAHVRYLAQDDAKAIALKTLAGLIPDRLIDDVLSFARAFQDDEARIKVLSAIASSLPENPRLLLLDEALALAPQIAEKPFAEFTLDDLVLLLPDNRIEKSLDLARTIPFGDAKSRMLNVAVRRLPKRLLNDALQITRSLCEHHEVIEVLSYLASCWTMMCEASHHLEIDDLSATLHSFARTDRQQLLNAIQALLPVIHQLGGAQAIRETAQAIIDTAKWWP